MTTPQQLARELAEKCAQTITLRFHPSKVYQDEIRDTILRELNLEALVDDREKLSQLLFMVERKFENETRYQTALRYIKEAEAKIWSSDSAMSAQGKEE